MQYKAYDENHKPFDSEITAMSFDPSKRRLMTSSKVGCLRIWNFNNGDLLHELPNIENMEISSLVWDRQRIITGKVNSKPYLKACIYVIFKSKLMY